MKTLLSAVAILAFSTSSYAGDKAEANITKSKQYCLSLAVSIQSYRDDYGYFPASLDKEKDTTFTSSADFISVIDGTDEKSNPRKKRYLFLDAKRLGKKLLDPWGREYQVVLDCNYDGKLTYKGNVEEASVIVYSLGPDGKVSKDDIVTKF